MDSKLLVTIHLVSVNLFLLVYLIKLILLFTSKARLDAFSKFIKVPEMIISTAFLGTGIWLYAVLGAIKWMQIMKLASVLLSIPLAVAGFKNHNKGLALISVLLLVCAYGISEASRNKPYIPQKVELSGDVTSPGAQGIQLYLMHCAMCHGPAGDKEYRGAAPLTISPMDTTAAVMIIRSGVKRGPRGTMPAFGELLSEEQISVVAAYVQGLKK